MARKIIVIVCFIAVNHAFGQNTQAESMGSAILDSSHSSSILSTSGYLKPLNLWKALKANPTTHLGLGISPGFNNTVYFKASKRLATPELPFGFYQSIEYATEHNLPYNTGSPLFFLPTGAIVRVNDKWSLLAGVDLLTKVLYQRTGLRKEIAVCYQWNLVPITFGYSFSMGPTLMVGIPVF